VKGAAKDLEPYRRLVELQRQMIELAQKHEQTRRRRDALSELMAREAAARRPGRRGLRHRIQRSAARLLKRVSEFTLEKTVPATNHKQTWP
jgi:seryl-tRNA synthetase